jgi:syntaxin-binding protein 1
LDCKISLLTSTSQIASVCIALQEYPTVRYYRPLAPTHEAAVLSEHLARAVQNELDSYAHWNPEFAQPSNRPKAALYVMDRSIDLSAPLLHEFTYQAMAHDLLPIKEKDKVTFRTVINEGRPNEEIKDMEISDKDKVWVNYRHLHMKDTIEKLMADFQKFIDANPHFAKADEATTNVNAIKDMLAGLPQFQEMKEAYSLHLTMAQDCMNIFQEHKLPELAGVEQVSIDQRTLI